MLKHVSYKCVGADTRLEKGYAFFAQDNDNDSIRTFVVATRNTIVDLEDHCAFQYENDETVKSWCIGANCTLMKVFLNIDDFIIDIRKA